MSGEEYFEQLCSNSLDGTLTDAEREALRAHLAECPACAALRRELERTRAWLSEEVSPPAELHGSIMERLRQENALRVVQPEKPARRLLPAAGMVAAAAAVVLVALGGGLMPVFSTIGGSSGVTAADSGTAEAAEADWGAADAAAEPGDSGAGSAASDAAAAPETASGNARAGGGAAESETDRDSSGGAAVPFGAALSVPESLQGTAVAHCYIAWGGREMPDIGGELAAADGEASWFLLDNNLDTIQQTLQAAEDAGCTVTAYDEETPLTIDSKAAKWVLIVV